jgi:hypothetical protein
MVLISVEGSVNPKVIVQPELLSHFKNPVASLWIEPATFQLECSVLSELCYRVPVLQVLKHNSSVSVEVFPDCFLLICY